MADYLEDLVQNIKTNCDLSGFVELSVAIEDATKKARSLSDTFKNAITGEQRIKIEELKVAQREATATTALHRVELEKQRQQTVLNNIEYEKERNNLSNNRLEMQRLINEKQKDLNATRLQMQETIKKLSQDRLQQSIQAGANAQTRLNTQLSRERVAQMRKETAEQMRLNRERRRGNLLMRFGRTVGTYVGAYIGLHTIAQLINTGSRIQLIQQSIEGLTKSTQDWNYIQQQAFKTGTEIEVVAKGYRNFFSSAKMAGFNKEGIQSMYADTLLATRSIGASTQQTEGALLALEQMLSKGTVSMEELRRQLGNAIPGAFEIGAKAMNMTTKQFNEFVKKGQLASSEFVPKFIKTLKETYADGFKNIEQTVSVAQIRLSNSWKILQSEIMSGETGKELAKTLNTVREFLDSPEFKDLVKLLSKIFNVILNITRFLIKYSKIIIILLGAKGIFGLLQKYPIIIELIKLGFKGATEMLVWFARAGIASFIAMNKSALIFLGTVGAIIAAFVFLEDLILGLGQHFLGWKVRSNLGDALDFLLGNEKLGVEKQRDEKTLKHPFLRFLNKPDTGLESLGSVIPDALKKDLTMSRKVSDLLHSSDIADQREAMEIIERYKRKYSTISDRPTYMTPISERPIEYKKEETIDNSVTMGDLHFNINSTNPQESTNEIRDLFNSYLYRGVLSTIQQ